MLHKVDRLLSVLLPRSCVFCGDDSGAQTCCDGCRDDLPWISNPCRGCGVPLSDGHPRDYCAVCCQPAGPDLHIRSALIYAYPLDRIIAGAKFHQRLDFAAALGGLLGDYLCRPAAVVSGEFPDVIVPVPLHRRRLAARGFNQAAEIAAPVARRLGVPLHIDGCARVRHTIEQSSLTGRARRRNLIGAFVARSDLAGMHVAIVDDVLTTGTTVAAVAAAVFKAGARKVNIWTVARTDKFKW
jgi:ComF family protein